MAYADYNFYTNTYGGDAISASDFAVLAERASDYIDYITRDKADASDVKVKKACCAMAEQIQSMKQAELDAAGLQSETVGSWSVTFRSGQEINEATDKALYQIATRYLSAYLYRGGGCRCTCRM